MTITYKNNKLEKSLSNATILKKYGLVRSKKIKKRLTELEEADSLSDILTLPVRLHAYIGDRIGDWSIDIQENWRIIFEIVHDPIPKLEDGGVNLKEITIIKIVSIEDPH